MSFDATARQRVAPGAEKQSHRLPADGFFAVLRKVDMTKNERLRFWQEMRENDFMLVDAPARKIAVFSNTSGMIVLAVEDDGQQVITEICFDEMSEFEALLASAKDTAMAITAQNEAEFAIWLAKRGGA